MFSSGLPTFHYGHIRITSAMFPAFTASVRLRDMVVQVASKLVDEVWGEEMGEEMGKKVDKEVD